MKSPESTRHEDQGVAMLFVLMCMILAATLSILVLGALTSELRPTAFQNKTVRSINSAESGLQAGLSVVRTAWTTSRTHGVVGDPKKLPCSVTGEVGGTGAPTYRVQVDYYLINPSGQSALWRTQNALTCVPGAGPQKNLVSVNPLYALIRSSDTSAATNITVAKDRSAELTYTFDHSDVGYLGGQIHTGTKNPNLRDLCWTAHPAPGSQANFTGTGLTLETCTDVTSSPVPQTFSYRADYSIVLSSTQTSPGEGGLCLDAQPVAPNSGLFNPPTLEPCISGQTSQQWSYNDQGFFEVENSSGTGLSRQCLDSSAFVDQPNPIIINECRHNVTVDWKPDATVGAGAAGDSTFQLINYGEYGRCLDVRDANLRTTFLIDYPCKQDPTPGAKVLWNQRWTWDGKSATSGGSHRIQSGRTGYCLTAPNGTDFHRYVIVGRCNQSPAQQWIVMRQTTLRSTSFTIVRQNDPNTCLSLGPHTDIQSELAWSTITLAPCDGSYIQKWNAPAESPAGNLGNLRETTSDG